MAFVRHVYTVEETNALRAGVQQASKEVGEAKQALKGIRLQLKNMSTAYVLVQRKLRKTISEPTFWESCSRKEMCHRVKVLNKAVRLESSFVRRLRTVCCAYKKAKVILDKCIEEKQVAEYKLLLSKCFLK
ncbi:hypothetical protein DAPPUDRAFT_340728 [Daphnia pulex]|uniref:Uncharacterized protein n=1 Tax=Daphnia pulex TaxID=6669 RepID=E9I4N1_DAPPU|nr:hypothetical protein DAPPUDRAFT_340728 [Daphnia pulex]|eukprot:EFX61049.1 hypothetical protein DAPPUDRAFT_340728 [Daphnia pulex]